MEFLKSATTSGGGVKYSNTSTQSLASISEEISTYGIFMEFASSTMNANNSRENIFKELFNGGCTRLDLPVENKQIKFSGFQSTLNYISSFDSDKISYKKNFSSLIHSFSLFYSFKNPWENNLDCSSVESFDTSANKKQTKPDFFTFTNKKTEGNPCDSTAMNCTWDPRGFIFDSADITKTGKVYYGKYQPDTTIPNFYDVAYADDNVDMLLDDYDKSSDILPGCPTMDGCSQEGKSLYYYVYYPKHNYSECPLPVVFLFHAGGFSDCSQLNYEDDFCRMIARKGFIVINVEYRRGRIKDTSFGGKYTAVQQSMANYRAFQDGRGAIRTVILDQRNIATNHLPYRIDTSNVNIAGQSAGGMIATNLCLFTTQGQVDSVFQSPAGLKKISTALGSMDTDFYRGPPDIEFHSKIKTLWCMWGAVPIPMVISNAHNEYNFLTRNGSVPLIPSISFMGAQDPVFPPNRNKQFVYYPIPPPSTYTIESGCMVNSPFELSSNNNKKQFRLECTYDLYTISKANNVPALIYIDCDMRHGLEHNPDKDAPLSSNFGLMSVTPTLAAVNNYMASRFTFFARAKYIGLWDSLLGPSKFIDCEDYRHGCTKYADHCDTTNASCSDNFVGE